jgi:hypothetical protein
MRRASNLRSSAARGVCVGGSESRSKATGYSNRREDAPLDHFLDEVDPDHFVINDELSLWGGQRGAGWGPYLPAPAFWLPSKLSPPRCACSSTTWVLVRERERERDREIEREIERERER